MISDVDARSVLGDVLKCFDVESHFINEIFMFKGSPHEKETLFQHSVQCANLYNKSIQENSSKDLEFLRKEVKNYSFAFLVGLFHDLGKVYCVQNEGNKQFFTGHGPLGARFFRHVFSKYIDSEDLQKLCNLINFHMCTIFNAEVDLKIVYKINALMQLVPNFNSWKYALYLLKYADSKAKVANDKFKFNFLDENPNVPFLKGNGVTLICFGGVPEFRISYVKYVSDDDLTKYFEPIEQFENNLVIGLMFNYFDKVKPEVGLKFPTSLVETYNKKAKNYIDIIFESDALLFDFISEYRMNMTVDFDFVKDLEPYNIKKAEDILVSSFPKALSVKKLTEDSLILNCSNRHINCINNEIQGTILGFCKDTGTWSFVRRCLPIAKNFTHPIGECRVQPWIEGIPFTFTFISKISLASKFIPPEAKVFNYVENFVGFLCNLSGKNGDELCKMIESICDYDAKDFFSIRRFGIKHDTTLQGQIVLKNPKKPCIIKRKKSMIYIHSKIYHDNYKIEPLYMMNLQMENFKFYVTEDEFFEDNPDWDIKGFVFYPKRGNFIRYKYSKAYALAKRFSKKKFCNESFYDKNVSRWIFENIFDVPGNVIYELFNKFCNHVKILRERGHNGDEIVKFFNKMNNEMDILKKGLIERGLYTENFFNFMIYNNCTKFHAIDLIVTNECC